MKNKNILTILLSLFIIIILFSCKTKYEYIEVPKEVIKTEYKEKLIHDSIYTKDSTFINIKGDTIYQTSLKYLYKYRYLRDTLYNKDTIKITTIKPIEVVKTETINKIYWYQKFLIWCGGVFILFIIYNLIKYFKNKKWI